MEIDEVLLNSALTGLASLRFYQWDQPTVSLGHFQAKQALEVPLRFSGLPIVRRLSGGGAILHDQELTYSCALPAAHPICRDPGKLYDVIHAALIAVLTQFQVHCRVRGEDAFADQSFLCFSRGDARDIVIGRQKIVGSAQRRRQGAILQHGSILLRQSRFAPEFPGIRELTNVDLAAEALVAPLTAEITSRLELTAMITQSLSEKVLCQAKLGDLCSDKESGAGESSGFVDAG